ncbi:MAG: hypothetical protein AAGB12_00205 [Pseudomonadota bacterium]
MAGIDEMGVTNQGWGVCGFTSTFYALYNRPDRPAQIINANQAFRVLAEIKTFLKMLQADGEIQKLNDIEAFTQSFGNRGEGQNYAQWTIESYITKINGSVNKSEQEIVNDAMFGIAIPPHVLQDYLKRAWDIDSTATWITGTGFAGEGIIGVKSTDEEDMTLYNGLCHYMYQSNNKIYSWGRQFSSIQEADSDFRLVLAVAFDT